MFKNRPFQVLALLGFILAIAALVVWQRHPASDPTPQPALATDRVSSLDSEPPTSGGVSVLSENPEDTDLTWIASIPKHDLRDPGPLIEALLKIQPDVERHRALGKLISRWVVERPIALYDWLESQLLAAETDDLAISEMIENFGEALSYLDPSVTASPDLGSIIRQVVAGMALENPTKALSWANTWLLGDALDAAKASVVIAIAEEDTNQAMSLLAEIQTDLRRQEAIVEASRLLASQDLDAAQAWASGLKSDMETSLAMNGILSTVAQSQPEVASTMLTIFAGKLAGTHATRIAREKSELLAQGFTRHADELGNALFVKGDFEVQFSPLNPDTELLGEAIGTIAGGMAATDPASAIRWVESLPDGVLRRRGLEAAIIGTAQAQPLQAVQMLRDHLPTQTGPVEAVFHLWAARSPADAMAAAGSLNAAQNAAAQLGVVTGMLENPTDPKIIAQWARALPRGPGRDAALSELSAVQSLETPDQAWNDALEISDPNLRFDAMRQVFPALLRKSDSLARQAIQNQAIPAEDRERLARMLDVSTN